ncbi:BatA domain-containing protein [Polaribacter dokdonensis]|uniref:N-terminal double-transmembrane domain-containing protein n=1 Tax=Polaribacter dokdonensis DSW-5 TaxID=1300348 RepID=A0A0M9CHU9_9FLAO|nr:BatA domain-containing protein [Polaribacter dokdonensis]KOY52931.1 N-terminal double-transmembrane domain-containing protein [Polaribacter dokdonensis DSW-5]SEE54640.1 N-terminal double-transmembrane domain-containing protein [Polaribacter dokdonensis DSW-5]
MQFKNTEIFYLFALLIIPIIVHLFQLQKFKKIPFTNVAFLQKIEQQTRKSSSIKKWLILANRILLFSAILFAFSQPYFGAKNNENENNIYIYLDNSLSLDTKGEKGNVLKNTIQEIIENAPQNAYYSLLTNSNYFEKIDYLTLKNELIATEKSSKNIKKRNVLLKIEKNSLNEIKTLSDFILLSDFQNTYYNEFTNVTPAISAIQLQPSSLNNLSIDSVFISNKTNDNLNINVIVKNQGEAKNGVPIAIFNDQKLVSKQTFSIDKNASKQIEFTVQNQTEFLGKIELSFSDTFSFDNIFYFALNTSKKINVLAIGKDLNFLSKIYSKDEFNFTSSTAKNINYNSIENQEIIILNELENIPEILIKSLDDFSKKNATIVLLPNLNSELSSYNSLLSKFGNSRFQPKILDSLKITSINFDHPLFKNVFSKKVTNFQYPKVNSYFPILSSNRNSIIDFENKSSFISELKSAKGSLYVLSSSLSKENSNFLNSPLIVPVFYNFGKLSYKNADLYYYLQEDNTIDISVELGKDKVLKMSNENTTFIPAQQTYQNKVSFSTNDLPKSAGFYYILKDKDTLQTIAYNNPKEESSLEFLDINLLRKTNKNIKVENSIASAFKEIYEKNEVQWLWKWFLTLAIVSLLLEILILKFYKP